MSQRKLARFAAVTSLVIHTVGLAAMATWSTDSVRSRAQFAGHRQAIELLVSTADSRWSPEVAVVASDSDPQVVIEPQEARIAKRRYLQSPVGEMSGILAEASIPASPSPQKRAQLADVPERSWNHTNPSPKVLERRTAPARVRVEPPSSLGNSDETPPDLSHNAPPTYPLVAIQRRWEGTVLLRIRIDATGQVSQVEIARTSGYPVLDGAAASAVRRWRGIPAHQAGRPVATVELLPVRFKL